MSEEQEMPQVVVNENHEWLQKLIGKWRIEGIQAGGTEEYRAFGPAWVIGESSFPMGEMAGQAIVTLGWDPAEDAFVGTWVGTMMNKLWVYRGILNESRTILTLNSEGPAFDGSEGTHQYRDIVEFLTPDHRTLTAQVQGSDGEWTEFMKSDYFRI